MRAYSMDLRVGRSGIGWGVKADDVAAKYQVSGSWVRLLKQRRRETGEVAPRQRYGRGQAGAASPAPRDLIQASRIARWSNSKTGWRSTSVSRRSGARWMRWATPSKKTVHASEHDRPDIRAAADLAGRHAADRSAPVRVSR